MSIVIFKSMASTVPGPRCSRGFERSRRKSGCGFDVGRVEAGDEDLYFISIQAEAGSLHQARLQDGIPLASKASWMAK